MNAAEELTVENLGHGSHFSRQMEFGFCSVQCICKCQVILSIYMTTEHPQKSKTEV